MNKAIVSLLLAITACAFFSVTSATNTACFNANGEITRVFCDGRDLTSRLVNRDNVNKCDCLRMDICKNITIRAKGVKDGGQSRSGIGLCQTSMPTPYKDWTCTKSIKDRRWKSQKMSYRRWRPAQKSKTTKRCHHVKTLPCKQEMFWNEGIDAPSVDCILFQCGDECKSCKKTGPGKCDPGMCNYGSDVNSQTGESRCNRRCRIDWLAWGQRDTPTTKGEGYIRITDMRSQSTDEITANIAGYYFAIVDMDRCTFVNRTYTNWTIGVYDQYGAPSGDSLVNLWSMDSSKANVMGVELAVGGVNFTTARDYADEAPSFSPASTIYRFGTGARDLPIIYNRNCSISAIFTGFQFGMTNLEVKVNKPGTKIYPNNDC